MCCWEVIGYADAAAAADYYDGESDETDGDGDEDVNGKLVVVGLLI